MSEQFPDLRFAAEEDLASCHTCGRLSPVSQRRCPRCHTPLHLRKPQSLARTSALLLASILFYIPAMSLPVMRIEGIGGAENSTILSGVITFWEMKSYPVAIIIFTASVLIPILKILALGWLCLAARGNLGGSPKVLAATYHITELVGRWSMVDVFVVAILACLVRLGSLMTITPGP
ncbi:MAG: paraquat-inducible protein A, partial [Verrucomicrobiales bacterium]